MDPDIIVSHLLDFGYELQDILEAMENSESDEEIIMKLEKAKENEKKYLEAKAEFTATNDEQINIKLQEKIQAADMKKKLKENTLKENSIKEEQEKIFLDNSKPEKTTRVLRPFLNGKSVSLFYKSSYIGFAFSSSKKKKLIKIPPLSSQVVLEFINFKVNDAGSYLASKRYSIHQKEFSSDFNINLPPENPEPAKIIKSIKTEQPLVTTFKTLNEKPSVKLNLVYADSTTGGIILNQPEENDPEAPDPTSNYFKLLSQYKVIESSDPQNFSNYSYTEQVNLSNEASRRISREIKTLEKSLPCDAEASIFFMYDDEDMGKMRVLVSGPSGTVYSYGLYLFDVRIPADYPRSPPKVQLCTTGNGKIRFNPNMYHNGKVCLSIINTWKGASDEMWNPSTSTLLQVFLSIQAMVMGNKIIQNEPTFEMLPEDCPENILYQYEVRYGNLKYAIIENLRNPPKGFEEVVHDHFIVLKERVMDFAENCLELSRTFKPFPSVKTQNPYLEIIFSGASVFKTFQKFLFELQEIIRNKYY